MTTKAAMLRRNDAFAVLGDAVAASATAMNQSASDARDAALKAVPAVRSALGKAIYVAAYGASYGAVVGALAIGRLAPSINALAYGVHDGAVAARGAGRNGAVRTRSAAKPHVRGRRPPGRRGRRSAAP